MGKKPRKKGFELERVQPTEICGGIAKIRWID